MVSIERWIVLQLAKLAQKVEGKGGANGSSERKKMSIAEKTMNFSRKGKPCLCIRLLATERSATARHKNP